MPHGVALLLLALYALPLFFIRLGSGDANAMMELFNLVPIHETVRYGHWLMPTLDGLPRMEKPPLPVWVPAAMARLFGTDNLWVLRFPSALLGVLTCWATYGLGCIASRDRKLGLFAGLILAGMFVFTRQARLASYDIYCTAFTTVGFMALLAMVERPARTWAWALLAGLAMGLAVLSKGPVPPLFVCIPFGVWMLRYHRRRKAWLGLLLALVVSIVVFVPWLVLVARRYAEAGYGNAWAVWLRQFVRFSAARSRQLNDTRWYYFGFLGWVAPWTPALVAGLLLPFLPASSNPLPSTQEKRGRWLFWLVVVLGLALLTLPHQKKQRYALQQFPAAALLAAAVWQEFTRLRRTTLLEPAAKVLLFAQALLIGGAGALLVAFAFMLAFGHYPPFHAQLTHWSVRGALGQLQPAYRALGFAGWLLTALVLVAAGLLLWRWQVRRRFALSFAVYAVGTWLLLFSITFAYRSKVYQHSPYRRSARAMVRAAHGRKVYTLIGDRPWLGTLYYADEILPQVYPPQLRRLATATPGPLYLLTRRIAPYSSARKAACTASGRTATALMHLFDGHHNQTLYVLRRAPYSPAKPGPAAAPHPGRTAPAP